MAVSGPRARLPGSAQVWASLPVSEASLLAKPITFQSCRIRLPDAGRPPSPWQNPPPLEEPRADRVTSLTTADRVSSGLLSRSWVLDRDPGSEIGRLVSSSACERPDL